MAEACRRFLTNYGRGSGRRKGAAEVLPYLARNANMKKKLVGEELARRTVIELSKSGAPNRIYGVVATIVNLPNSYDKQETNPERLERAKVRGEGNNVKVKYGALRYGDDRDADGGKAPAGALAKLTSANNPRYKKVFGEKHWNDCRRNVLVNLNDEIVLRGAGVVQNMANSRKKSTEAVLEAQGSKVL